VQLRAGECDQGRVLLNCLVPEEGAHVLVGPVGLFHVFAPTHLPAPTPVIAGEPMEDGSNGGSIPGSLGGGMSISGGGCQRPEGGCKLAPPPPHVELPDSRRRHRQTHGLSIMAHPHIHAHTLPPVDDSRPPPH